MTLSPYEFRLLIEKDNLAAIKQQVEQEGFDVNADLTRYNTFGFAPIEADKNYWGFKPLHWAACTNKQKIARYLIKKGANVNDVNRIGNTPLHTAIYYRHFSLAKLLLQFECCDFLLLAGIPEHIDYELLFSPTTKSTAAYVIAENKVFYINKSSKKYFDIPISDNTIEQLFATFNILPVGQEEKKRYIRGNDKKPLSFEELETITNILRQAYHGTDVNRKNTGLKAQILGLSFGNFIEESDSTPLHYAVRWGDANIVNEILKKKPEIDEKDYTNKTALEQMLERSLEEQDARSKITYLEKQEIICHLIKNGANPLQYTSEGDSILHIAIEEMLTDESILNEAKQFLEVIPTLIFLIKHANNKGEELVSQLLTKCNDQGKSPLGLASELGNLGVALLLKRMYGVSLENESSNVQAKLNVLENTLEMLTTFQHTASQEYQNINYDVAAHSQYDYHSQSVASVTVAPTTALFRNSTYDVTESVYNVEDSENNLYTFG